MFSLGFSDLRICDSRKYCSKLEIGVLFSVTRMETCERWEKIPDKEDNEEIENSPNGVSDQ